MNFLEIEYGPFAAYLALLVFVLIGVKFPSALAFSFQTSRAFAWVPIFGVTNYAKALFALQCLAAVLLFAHGISSGAFQRLLPFLKRRESILLWVLLLIWLKIAADVVSGGLDSDRRVALETSAVQIFLPTLLILMSFLVQPPIQVLQGICIGMVAFSLVCIVPALPGVFEGRRFQLALQGTERLSLWGLDTIQGGMFFLYLALGGMGLSLMLPRHLVWAKPLGWMLFALGFFCLTLNATRQFMLACLVALVIALTENFRKGLWVAIVGCVFFALAASLILKRVGDAAVTTRLTTDALSGEAETSRGVIWKDALIAGGRNPLTGAGFRKFGEIASSQSELTGEVSFSRDTAHGFLQDVWAEHGAGLGLLALFGSFVCMKSIVRSAISSPDPFFWGLLYLDVSLFFTCIFSGAVYVSLAPYVLATSVYPLSLLRANGDLSRRVNGEFNREFSSTRTS